MASILKMMTKRTQVKRSGFNRKERRPAFLDKKRVKKTNVVELRVPAVKKHLPRAPNHFQVRGSGKKSAALENMFRKEPMIL